MKSLDQFANQKFLNLETLRKNGQGVRTPVWFTQDGGTLYVRTVDGSGKVKRVHNNPFVNVAPCAVDGKLLGEWVPARARHVQDPAVDRKVAQLIRRKYGPMSVILALRSRLRRNKYAILEIRLAAEEAK